jgi:hypothetical protein
VYPHTALLAVTRFKVVTLLHASHSDGWSHRLLVALPCCAVLCCAGQRGGCLSCLDVFCRPGGMDIWNHVRKIVQWCNMRDCIPGAATEALICVCFVCVQAYSTSSTSCTYHCAPQFLQWHCCTYGLSISEGTCTLAAAGCSAPLHTLQAGCGLPVEVVQVLYSREPAGVLSCAF